MYEVHLSKKADKFLQKLDENLRERIIKRLKRLADDPVPSDSKFVWREEGEKVFRYRIGTTVPFIKLKKPKKLF